MVKDFSNSFCSMASNCWIKFNGFERFDHNLELLFSLAAFVGWGFNMGVGCDDEERVLLRDRFVLAIASSRGLLFCRWCLVLVADGFPSKGREDELSSLYKDF